MSKSSKIAIIGAGISGLACADKLIQNGFEDVIILEATDRIGGRISTLWNGCLHYELGAQYVHGQNNNPIYQILSEEMPDIKRLSFESYDVNGSHNFNLPTNLLKYASEVCDVCANIDNYLSTVNATNNDVKDVGSYGDYALAKFKECIQDENNLKIIKLKKALFDWHMRLIIEANAADPLTHLSAALYDKYVEFDGFSYTEFNFGYDTVVKSIIKRVNKNKLYLKSAVTEIDWNADQVVVTCDDKAFEVDHVIVTIPLGVLKDQHTNLFNPHLPKINVAAIDSIGFGTVNKIFLRFESVFWNIAAEEPTESFMWTKSFNVLLPDERNYQGRDHEAGYASFIDEETLRDTWHRYIVRFCTILSDKNVLCAWLVGEGAKYSENLPDEMVIGKCREIIIDVMKKPDIEIPTLVGRSKWYTDPYTKGSYSYMSTHCDKNFVDNDHLCTPVHRSSTSKKPCILFAGEATHSTMFSTTHGALLSGYREADRLKSIYKQ